MSEFLTDNRNLPSYTTATIKIGEFLKLLEVMSPQHLDETLAAAQELKIPVGRATVLRGLLTNNELSNLIQLHCLVRCNAIMLEDAKEAFSMAKRKGWQVRECLIALGCPIDDAATVRIGELLIESERISDQDLDFCLELQKLCGLPLGRILTIDACVPELVINEALTLQSEIRQRKRDYKDAVLKLKRLKVSNEELQARKKLLLNRYGAADGAVDFCDLLMAANVVRRDELSEARKRCDEHGDPLSEALRELQWVDKSMLSAAAALHGLMRDGYLSGPDAVAILKRLRRSDTETLDDLPVLGCTAPQNIQAVSLYQFLVMSGLLTADDIRELIRRLMADPDMYKELTGQTADVSAADQRFKKSAIIKTIVDSDNLEKALSLTHQFDQSLIHYARDLLALISLGVIHVDQAILSFARLRYGRSQEGKASSP